MLGTALFAMVASGSPQGRTAFFTTLAVGLALLITDNGPAYCSDIVSEWCQRHRLRE